MKTFSVMVSSTTQDLQKHRKEAREAILRCHMYPVEMETIGSTGNDPITDSLNMVKRSEIYILILGRRYGYIPDKVDRNPKRLSMTQMEYKLAKKRNIQRYIFVMDDEHPLTLNRAESVEIESDEHREKLRFFRDTVTTEETVAFFKSPEELRGLIIQALSKHEVVAEKSDIIKPTLPIPPNLFAAPPYTSIKFVGRDNEKQELNRWLEEHHNPIMIIRSIGGQGKSALMWDWIQEKKQYSFNGIIWWNFDKGSLYEADGGHIQTFLRYAIAYILHQDPDDLKNVPYPKLIQQFISQLQNDNYLVVLDGLERILVAYNRFDSSHLYDESIKDDEDLRDCINPQDFAFLRHLIHLSKSKILIGTRLFPTALEDEIGNALDGVNLMQLGGIDPLDARQLMGKLGVRFSDHKNLDRFMEQLGYHGLMLTLSAGHIAKYHRARGNFDEWYKAHSIHTWEKEAHSIRNRLLEFAIDGLSEEKRQFLEDISAFRGTMTNEMIDPFNPYLPAMPPKPELPLIPPTRKDPFCLNDNEAITFISESVQAQIIEQRQHILDTYQDAYEQSKEWIQSQSKFDILLTELEDRGLLEWNRDDWTYDLHPVVRAFAHDKLDNDRRSEVYMKIQDHFASFVPLELKNIKELSELDELIEYYLSLLNSGDIKLALSLYRQLLYTPLQNQLNDYQTILRLLNPIVENHLDKLKPDDQSRIQHDYALALESIGKVEAAANFVSGNFVNDINAKKPSSLIVSLIVYARHIMLQNKLPDVEKILSIAEDIARTADLTRELGWVQEYQIELYTLIGDRNRVKELAHQIVLERKSPEIYVIDRTDLALKLAYSQLDFGNNVHDIIEELWGYLEANWRHNLERNLHRLKAKQAILDGDFDLAENELIQTIRMSNENGRSVALLLAHLALVWQTKNSPKASRAMSDALKRWCNEQDKALLYTLATEYFIKENQEDKARSYLNNAYHYAMINGLPYIHGVVLEKAEVLADKLNFKIPQAKEYVETQKVIPFEVEILDYLEDLRTNPLQAKKGGNLAPTKFKWAKVHYLQVLAVCEFDGFNSIEDDRVRELVCEMHGLSANRYDSILHVFEDDSTEIEILEHPIQQIRASEAKALRLYNDIKPSMGSIVLIASQDEVGDFYAIVYCLAEEILRFVIECATDEYFDLNDYYVKLLWEERGDCISSQHKAEIWRDYKINGDKLTLIHA